VNAEKNIPWLPFRFASRRNLIAALIAVTLLSAPAAWADGDIAKQIKFEYLGKVLTLRHFYSGERLSFHSDGTLQGDAPIGPWTLDGQIEVEDVQLRGAKLAIKGRRIHRIFDAQRNPQDQLSTIGNNPDKQHKELEKELRRLRVEIQIDLPSDKPDEKDVTSAIHAVFLASSESMMDIVPSYWRAYFAKQEGKPAPQVKGPPQYSFKPGGGVLPPHVILQPDPEYSEEARKAKYQGTAVMSLIVDASGRATDLQIQRPLGLGLDEKAVAAISTWKFEPAEKNGEPVSAAILVEVSFRLY
jgi:TonB family protein